LSIVVCPTRVPCVLTHPPRESIPIHISPIGRPARVSENIPKQRASLALLTVAELLALAPWFSTAAVAPQIQTEWTLSATAVAWLTIAVQLGFVVGTLGSGLLNLPDRMDAARLFALSAGGTALTTAVFAVTTTGMVDGVLFRFLTGVFLAGVYPPGMKLATTWTRQHRGLALALIVGALTIGSASPHLVRALLDVPWRHVVLVTAALALIAGVTILVGVRQGPFSAPAARFNPRFVLHVFRARGTRLALLGYLGHQWELYAMWAWLPLFLLQIITRKGGDPSLAAALSFTAIALGGAGSVVAGAIADRVGRTAVATAAMIISGSMAIVMAGLINGPLWILIPITFLWGLSVVADSAQFSAAISELSPPKYVGSALTTQTSIGFLLTFPSIHLIGLIIENQSRWALAFILLALGPVIGICSMLRLRALPEAARMAGGRR